VSKRASTIRFSGPFFVENLTGSSREEAGPFPAVLVVGVSNSGEILEQPHLTCHLMSEGEIDYEIDQLQRQLEAIRNQAKKLLAKHREDDQRYFLKRGLLPSPNRPAKGTPG
jgi:hypothetical protein